MVFTWARLTGFALTKAIGMTSKAASFVIQHHDAIVETSIY
ncbi:MAG: hypothetical protein OCD00_10295 [Colwellia sp.]